MFLVYHRGISPKLERLRNSTSGNELEQSRRVASPVPSGQSQNDYDPDRVALIPFPDDVNI